MCSCFDFMIFLFNAITDSWIPERPMKVQLPLQDDKRFTQLLMNRRNKDRIIIDTFKSNYTLILVILTLNFNFNKKN